MDPDKIVDSAFKALDDNVESAQERQATLTERLKIDNTSPFKLPHLIRPITALWSMGIYTIVVIILLIQKEVEPITALGTTGGILATVIGFYFNSRKAEKINAKKSSVALEIERERAKVEIQKERMLIKQSKKDARKARKS